MSTAPGAVAEGRWGETLEAKLAQARREIPSFDKFRARLERDGARITWCSPVWSGLGAQLLHVQTPDVLQRRFGLAPELPVLVAPGHLMIDTVRKGRSMAASEDRLEQSLLIVADERPDLPSRLLGFTRPESLLALSDPGALFDRVTKALPGLDPFDVRDPVRGAEVFGRGQDIIQLRKAIERFAFVGVFGLRKMGKTTLALAVQAEMERQREGGDAVWRFLWADLQVTQSEGCDALANRLAARVGGSGRGGLAALRAAVEAAVTQGSRVCVVLDEIDLLVDGGNAYAAEAVSFLGLLRGLCQQHADHVRVLAIGRRPDTLNGARILGTSNPVFQLVRPHWVGPLSREAAGTLLLRLGKKAGLAVDHTVKSVGWELCMGHPLMTRLYGSHLLRLARGRLDPGAQENLPTDQSDAVAARRAFLRDTDAREMAREVLDIVRELDADAHVLLKELAADPAPSNRWTEAEDTRPEAADLLRNFGIVDEHGVTLGLLSHHVHRWARGQAA